MKSFENTQINLMVQCDDLKLYDTKGKWDHVVTSSVFT